MAYDPVRYFSALADEAEASGRSLQAASLRVMAKEAKAKQRADAAATRAARKSARQQPSLLGFAAAGRSFIIKPY